MSNKMRISFPVDDDLYKRINRIPWGVRAAVLRRLLERVIDAAEEHGELVYGAVIGGKFSIEYKINSGGRKKK